MLQQVERYIRRPRARLHAKFLKNPFEMLRDSLRFHVKNNRDFRVAFALAHPKKHFGFTLCDSESLQRPSVQTVISLAQH